MPRVLLHVRPADVLDDLDLDLLAARGRALQGWSIGLHDTRLSDAPFVTVIAEAAEITADAVRRLQSAFADLPHMEARLWLGIGREVPLSSVDASMAREASVRTPQQAP